MYTHFKLKLHFLLELGQWRPLKRVMHTGFHLGHTVQGRKLLHNPTNEPFNRLLRPSQQVHDARCGNALDFFNQTGQAISDVLPHTTMVLPEALHGVCAARTFFRLHCN